MGVLAYCLDNKTQVALYIGLLYASWKVIQCAITTFLNPLSSIPGPKICGSSRLYEFYWDSVRGGRLWAQLPHLHEKHGTA